MYFGWSIHPSEVNKKQVSWITCSTVLGKCPFISSNGSLWFSFFSDSPPYRWLQITLPGAQIWSLIKSHWGLSFVCSHLKPLTFKIFSQHKPTFQFLFLWSKLTAPSMEFMSYLTLSRAPQIKSRSPSQPAGLSPSSQLFGVSALHCPRDSVFSRVGSRVRMLGFEA